MRDLLDLIFVFGRLGNSRGIKDLLFAVTIVIIWTSLGLIFHWLIRRKVKQRNEKIKSSLVRLKDIEPHWDETELLKFSHERFKKIQEYWYAKDLKSLEYCLHHTLFPKWKMLMHLSVEKKIKSIVVDHLILTDIENHPGKERDCFTVYISACINETKNGFFGKDDDCNLFTEFWTFEYEKGTWVLRDIYGVSGWRKFAFKKIIDHTAGIELIGLERKK